MAFWGASKSAVKTKRLKLGYVDNLLTRPLVRGIEMVGGRADLHVDSHAAIRDGLAAGSFDIALVPSIEVIRHPEYRIIPSICVGTFGGSGLAVLCARVLPTEIQSILVDPEGEALEGLLDVLLPRQVMIRPNLLRSDQPVEELGPEWFQDPTTAIFFTGVAASQHAHEGYFWTWDVMQAWKKYASLPFVWYVWAVRPNTDLRGLESDMSALLLANMSKIDDVCADLAARTPVTREVYKSLYGKVMHYTLDNVFMAGLRRYAKELSDAGLVGGQAPIRPYLAKS